MTILRLLLGTYARSAGFIFVHVLLISFFYRVSISPIREFLQDRSERIVDLTASLARMEGIAREEGAVLNLFRKGDDELERGGFIAGANDGVIGANLQTRLKAITEAENARLISIQSLPSITKDKIRFVGVRLETSGTHAVIQRILHAVETGRPYLLVGALNLRPANSQQGFAIARPDDAAIEPLIDAEIEIFGAMLDEGRE